MTSIFRWLQAPEEKSHSAKLFRPFLTDSDDSQVIHLQQLKKRQQEQVQLLNDKSRTFLKAQEIRDRISTITRRNKERDLLVIPMVKSRNPMVDLLLSSNDNAKTSFAESVSDGLEILKKRHFDMIYVVVDMARDGHGPCFFSLDNPKDEKRRIEVSGVDSLVAMIRPLALDTEVVVVCGATLDRCPLAEQIFDEQQQDQREAV